MKRTNKSQSAKPNDIKGLIIKCGPLSIQAQSIPVVAWWGVVAVLILLLAGLIYLLTHLDTATLMATVEGLSKLKAVAGDYWRKLKGIGH